MPEFSDYASEVAEEIRGIQEALCVPLSTEGNELAGQLVQAEATYARLTFISSFAHGFLEGATSDAWRTAEGTVPEREAHVKAAVAQQRRFASTLDGLCKAILQRISLGQSLLRHLERRT